MIKHFDLMVWKLTLDANLILISDVPNDLNIIKCALYASCTIAFISRLLDTLSVIYSAAACFILSFVSW